jgi:hypothetical protein
MSKGIENANKILAAAEEAIRKLGKACASLGKSYGYLVVQRAGDARILMIAQVGECPPDKADKYLGLAKEKALRLVSRHADMNHRSSWESRDGKDCWGGAIVAGEYVVSFSGLSEEADEALALYVAVVYGWLVPIEAISITRISGNILFGQIS